MTDPQHDIQVVDNAAAGRFEAQIGGSVAGFADYLTRGNKVSFTHTEVDDRYEGQGVGSIVARYALDAVREKELSVLPLCPFVQHYIARHPEYLDLVAAEDRGHFELPTA